MRILVLGGTRFFGVHLVRRLLAAGHDITIATRGVTPDSFGASMRSVFQGQRYDAVCDNLAYCSEDIRTALEAVSCGRYVMTSSASVYRLHPDTREADFQPGGQEFSWTRRGELPYDEAKRGAECALALAYPRQNAAMVRFPYVIGPDDYTRRLAFYVEHAVRGLPMYIDQIDAEMGFVFAGDAGAFQAHLTESGLRGPVNGCNTGTASLREILAYVERRSGRAAILRPEAEPAPYNGTPPYTLNTERAAASGFSFPPLREKLFALLDFYIEQAKTTNQ